MGRRPGVGFRRARARLVELELADVELKLAVVARMVGVMVLLVYCHEPVTAAHACV